MPEDKTYTQAQVDEMVQTASDKGYKAAEAKLKGAEVEKDTQAKLTRLEQLEEAEAKRLAEAELNNTVSNLKADELKDTGLKGAAAKRFAMEHQDELKGLAGEELATKVKDLRENLDEEDKELFFQDTEVNASSSLLGGDGKDDDDNKVKYYPGTTIRKR